MNVLIGTFNYLARSFCILSFAVEISGSISLPKESDWEHAPMQGPGWTILLPCAAEKSFHGVVDPVLSASFENLSSCRVPLEQIGKFFSFLTIYASRPFSQSIVDDMNGTCVQRQNITKIFPLQTPIKFLPQWLVYVWTIHRQAKQFLFGEAWVFNLFKYYIQ